jgi:hypothetical protein
MIHGSMTRFALVAMFGTALASCSSAQEDNEFEAHEPIVTVVRSAQDQPRQLRVRAPRLRQGVMQDAMPHAMPEMLFFAREDGPRLGVMVDLSKDGLTVSEVNDDSLAEAAGVMVGDIVHRIGEERIDTVEDVAAALSHFSPGDAVPVAVIRAGEGIVELTGTMPEPPEREDAPLADGHRNGFLGVEIRESDDDGPGVEVGGTIPNSAAWFAGLDEGDRLLTIDGNAVDSYDALVGAVASKKPGTIVTLGYERDGSTHETSVRLGHRLPQNPMSLMLSPDGNRSFNMRLPGMQGRLPEGFEMYFGGEGDGDHPRILRFGRDGSMHGLHEMLQELDGKSRRIEVKLHDGSGKAIIETDDGTQVFIIEDGEWVHGDHDHDDEEHEHEDGPHEG